MPLAPDSRDADRASSALLDAVLLVALAACAVLPLVPVASAFGWPGALLSAAVLLGLGALAWRWRPWVG